MQRLPHKEGQLASVLDRGRNADSPGPVVIQVTEHEGQHLEVIHREQDPGVDADVEVDRVDGPLADALRDEEEVVPVLVRHASVDDRAWTGVDVVVVGPC